MQFLALTSSLSRFSSHVCSASFNVFYIRDQACGERPEGFVENGAVEVLYHDLECVKFDVDAVDLEHRGWVIDRQG